MSGALYRKYRSRSFKDVIGQEHITTTLVNSIENNSFAHAYLLTGPRGVGKTSVARLFAYRVNGLDYKENETYSDIIEIDAASNRRIDEIRELRDKINIAPSSLKYKVYIIDEVHMLTKEAFNALLKTLEEPPEHAIFILATTDFHKVPDTIVSRCVRFAFLSIPESSIEKHLQKIAKLESIDIEPTAIEIIADNSEGSFRDAISLLDQFRNSKDKVTAEYVSKVLGISPADGIKTLVSNIEQSKPKEVIKSLDLLRESGAGDDRIIKQLIGYLRDCLIGKEQSKLSTEETIGLVESLLAINHYSDARISLEIALLSVSARDNEKKPTSASVAKDTSAVNEENNVEADTTELKTTTNKDDDLWESILLNLKSNNSTLYGIARMAETKFDDGILELYFKFPFHFKQMKLERNYLIIEKTAKSINKNISKITLSVKEGSEISDSSTRPPKSSKEPVANISNIFGPSEVLES